MKIEKETILSIKGLNNAYQYEYEETKNITENCIEIYAKMKIDLNSKAAKSKLYKSWKKEKSPLLTQLQEIYKNHKTDLEENKAEKYYNIEE